MNRPARAYLSFLISSAFLLLFSGCLSPQRKVARRMDALKAEWQTNLLYQAHLPEHRLDWPDALAQMRAHNLKLRQAAFDLTNALESVRQVYRDLVPMLDLQAGATKRIVDLPAIGGNDVTFSADSFFNIPGLVSFGARLYVTRLALLRAQAAYALTEREQTIDLYKLFWAAQESLAQARHLENQKRTARAFATVDPFTGQLMLTEAELQGISDERDKQSLQERTAELLGSQEYRWILTTNSLPQLDYDTHPLPLEDTNRVAQLQLRLAAIELEAARAQITGIKLRYWPELNIFVTGPPVYQRYFGQDQFWKASELQASANAYWTIDTRGYISRQLRQTRRQQEIQQEHLRQDSLSLMQKLLFTRDLLKTTREKERDLEQELFVLEAVPPAQNLASLQKYATDYQTTADQLRQARRELAELNSLFWFVDESAWTNLPPLKHVSLARNE